MQLIHETEVKQYELQFFIHEFYLIETSFNNEELTNYHKQKQQNIMDQYKVHVDRIIPQEIQVNVSIPFCPVFKFTTGEIDEKAYRYNKAFRFQGNKIPGKKVKIQCKDLSNILKAYSIKIEFFDKQNKEDQAKLIGKSYICMKEFIQMLEDSAYVQQQNDMSSQQQNQQKNQNRFNRNMYSVQNQNKQNIGGIDFSFRCFEKIISTISL